ncbi:MAG TPA: DUF3857 domain-containing protein [Taishania sp.]|nr:DUF3857 domain-containing protein [Taishania sp.]
MKNKFSNIFGFVLIFSNIAYSQTNPSQEWKLLLENNRKEAYELAIENFNKNASIENLITREIFQNENGKLNRSQGFIETFKSLKNNEPYLYALWNKDFFFQDYTKNGFNGKNMPVIDQLYAAGYQNQTIKNALSYLKGAKERNLKNFKGFATYCNEVKSIRNWQYCGVFENLNNSGINAQYGPELIAKSDTPFNANSNGFVNWYTGKVDVEGWQQLYQHSEYGSGVHFAQTFINTPQDQEVYIRIGNSAKFILSINNIQVFENSKDYDTDLDAYVIKLNLKKGINRLLLKMASESSIVNFIVRLTDKDGRDLENLACSSTYSDFNTSSLEELAPVTIENEFEVYFKNKLQQNPDDLFSAYCLIKTYLRNEKHEEALEVLEPWLTAYPHSSFLRIVAISIHALDGDQNMIDELRENIKKDDPNYYLSLLFQFSNTQELFRMSQVQMEEVLNKYAKSIDDPDAALAAELIKAFRLQDKKTAEKLVDKLISNAIANQNVYTASRFTSIVEGYLGNPSKAFKIRESLNKKYFSTDIRSELVDYYMDHSMTSKAVAIALENVKWMPNDIYFNKDLVYLYHYLKAYNESMPTIDHLLSIFPYSFIVMELKGDALFQMGKKNEAIEYYNLSLVHNSGNSSLRKKIRDIQNQQDYIETYRTQDVYDFINKEKGKNKENNYGYNVLLDEATIELFKEAGGKSRITYVYEVTSDMGIENLKEYNLGLSGNYNIIKSEIIKKNGKIVPAEKMGSSFVFNGLEVGDIIYIDYQSNFTGYGRFYRDYMDEFQFTSFSPVNYCRYTLLAPKDMNIDYKVLNGELQFEQSSNDQFNVYTWTMKNHKGMPAVEKFMPENSDMQTVLHIGSVKSWSEIANWYSDLVRKQIEINSVVKKAFEEIFPSGYTQFSEYERAKKIYDYMAEKLSYSYVSFKQSGYVPQKPSKTLTTKLGDCKDFSTLFVVLTEMAGLQSNLVLVSTNESGFNSLVMPSQSFNHCIARVSIDGKLCYIELTDRNLPFRAIPNNILNAQILNIPRDFDKSSTYNLENLVDNGRVKNTINHTVQINVNPDNQKLKITTEMSGSCKSYTSSVLEKSYQLLKKDVLQRFERIVGSTCTVDTVYGIENVRSAASAKYIAEATLKEKPSKIGKYNVFKVPYIENAYTANLIAEEKRNYPINYLEYEDCDEYTATFDVFVKEGNVITEIPKNVELKYKNHIYIRKYTKVAPNHLRITVIAKPGIENISPEEYPAFKEYVTKVIEAKDVSIAFE